MFFVIEMKLLLNQSLHTFFVIEIELPLNQSLLTFSVIEMKLPLNQSLLVFYVIEMKLPLKSGLIRSTRTGVESGSLSFLPKTATANRSVFSGSQGHYNRCRNAKAKVSLHLLLAPLPRSSSTPCLQYSYLHSTPDGNTERYW